MATPIQKILPGLVLLIISLFSNGCNKSASSAKSDYDIVILSGRVIDPGSDLDAVRNVGISEGKIQMITQKRITGKTTIDASGLVVAPGFIDIHQHGQDQENCRYKVMDGVTTALELEMGTSDIDRWYSEREGKAIINHGASIGHVPLHNAGNEA